MPAKIKKGDEYLIRVKVTRVSEDGESVTLVWPAHGTPITVPARALDDEEKLASKG